MNTFIAPLLSFALLAILPHAQAQKRIIIEPDDIKAKEVSIDGIFDTADLWALTPDALEGMWKDKVFKWNSKTEKESAMIRRDNWGFGQVKLQAFGGKRNVEEVDFKLKGGKLAEVSILVWNKGDSENAEITEKDFNGIVEGWTQELTQRVAPKFENRGKDPASAARADRRMWIGKDKLAQLEYSGGKEKVRDPNTGRERAGKNFQGEFIRLRLMPIPTSVVRMDTSYGGGAKVRRWDLTSNVTHDPSGDVFIANIPMVDQGDKGYCAVATASRVFNYYGIPTDQHEMAQISGNSAGGGGTKPDEMEEAMKKISAKFKTRYQVLLDFDYSSHKYQVFMGRYNRSAKKLGKRILDTDHYIYFMGGLDPEVLRDVNGQGQPYEKFMKIVHENVDKGVPVMWALQLGLFPENGQKARQSGGGHMRLLIGYNTAKNEIIFSDSWGAGHEKKRMAAPDACAATMGLYLLQPGQ